MNEELQITPFLFLSEKEAEEKKFHLPSDDNLNALSDLFKMFGDRTRLSILYFLSQGELCVGDLAALMDMTPSAISHQLRLLKNAELVRFRREGKTLFYSLADNHVETITKMGLEHVQE